MLAEHTDAQGSVHRVVRFGGDSWSTITALQASTDVFSTQSEGLEAWAVARQPDTVDTSLETCTTCFVFDFGLYANQGYGMQYLSLIHI